MGGSVAGGGTGGTTDTGSGGEAGGGGASVIFDTDMGPDIDDAGALAVLHALADNAEVTLLAVGISTSRGTGSPAIGFIDQVDTYYSRPDIPIGIWKGGDFHGPDSNNYTQKIYDQSDKFPRSLDDSQDSVPEAFALYRQILAGEPDGSVTIVCTGFMNNMKALLESGPDENSDLDGTALVAAKVKELVQMGGGYPSGNEYNFFNQTSSGMTKSVVDNWPTPMVFSGYEIGDPIHTGAALSTNTPDTNPVRAAYEAFFGGVNSRSSWDITAALFAARGASTYWDLQSTGSNDVADDGSNAWQASPDLEQSYLVKKAENSTIEEVLSGLMTKAPGVAE
jgi:hypothetical protein